MLRCGGSRTIAPKLLTGLYLWTAFVVAGCCCSCFSPLCVLNKCCQQVFAGYGDSLRRLALNQQRLQQRMVKAQTAAEAKQQQRHNFLNPQQDSVSKLSAVVSFYHPLSRFSRLLWPCHAPCHVPVTECAGLFLPPHWAKQRARHEREGGAAHRTGLYSVSHQSLISLYSVFTLPPCLCRPMRRRMLRCGTSSTSP